MDDTIKLDRRSFEALAADSRIRILKSLAQQRKTLTELAKELSLSNSTMKEHLDVLVRAGLIIQRDEGRKWKYYDLTRKGEGIVNPHPTRVLIMLAISMVLVIASGWNLVGSFGIYSLAAADFEQATFSGGAFATEEATSATAPTLAPQAAPRAEEPEFLAMHMEDSWVEETAGVGAEVNEYGGASKAVVEEELEVYPQEPEEFPILGVGVFIASLLLLGASIYLYGKR